MFDEFWLMLGVPDESRNVVSLMFLCVLGMFFCLCLTIIHCIKTVRGTAIGLKRIKTTAP